MSVLTTDEIHDGIMAVLPSSVAALSPVVGGTAAALHLAAQAQSDLAGSLLIGTAAGPWLDLLARGMNVHRAPQEEDAGVIGSTAGGLRGRMRTVVDALTRPAILAAANDVLSAYGVADAIMVEWWEGPYADVDYADDPLMPCSEGPNTFCLIIPSVDGATDGDAYADHCYADVDYSGETGTSASYGAVYSAVDALRAAGVRWTLLIDTS